MAPFTDLVSECREKKSTKWTGIKKSPWHWDESHQKEFDDVKKIDGQDILMAYPDCSQPFSIYTDTSTRQLSAVVVQKNRHIAFFSQKFSNAQTQ